MVVVSNLSPPPDVIHLDVTKAKDIFNQNLLSTKATPYAGKQYVFSEAGLTPIWEDATYAENGKIAAYNMPISKQSGEMLIGGYNEIGEYQEIIIPLKQKIVVVKNIANDSSSVLVLALAPTPDYYRTNQDYDKEFVYGSKSKGGYSGYVFYEDLSGKPLTIHCYKDGKFAGFARLAKKQKM